MNRPTRIQFGRNPWGLLVLMVLVGFVFARPWLEEQLGFSLDPESVATDEIRTTGSEALSNDVERSTTQPDGVDITNALADSTPPANGDERSKTASPPLGKLKEVGKKVYVSTAGLKYLPGSADGHRLLHIMQHAKDNPEKPVHGVYNGNKEEILALIDEAWLLVKEKSPRVKSEEEGDRQVLTVDMQRVVGYTGGSVGQRKNHPKCTRVRIVVENEDEIVTAYPTDR